MGKPYLYTKEHMLEKFILLSKKLNKTPSMTDISNHRKLDKNFPDGHTYIDRFGSLRKVAELCGITPTTIGGKLGAAFLIKSINRFYKEFGRIPVQKDFENRKGYPSRKTFSNTFGSFNNALRAAGFDVRDKPDYTKEFLLQEIKRFIDEFGKQPYSAEMDIADGYPSKNVFTKVFGSWNNAIQEAGLKVRVSHYSDEELKDAFFRFIELNDRPPSLHEFNNNPDYPSFWCYQNRFGSWSKTYIAYGFAPNEGASGTHHEFENGEICKSNFEYDTSLWLRTNKISYLRNVAYSEFIEDYHGRKNCDYVIIHNGEFIWLEIAGLYTTREKKSGMEKDYIKRFDHKMKNLLSQFNYKVFYPEDFRKRTLDEMFSFLFDIPSAPWFEGEPIYQGVADEFEEVV